MSHIKAVDGIYKLYDGYELIQVGTSPKWAANMCIIYDTVAPDDETCRVLRERARAKEITPSDYRHYTKDTKTRFRYEAKPCKS